MDFIHPQKNVLAQELLDFTGRSPTAFHAVQNIARFLAAQGFSRLHEAEPWRLEPGHGYFVTRNGSSLIAFFVPGADFSAFRICASHSDSPLFKLKESPEIRAEKLCIRLNVEKYGGAVLAPWFDRPLSVAGRVVLRGASPFAPEERLVDIGRDLLLIPSLAVHLAKDAPSGGKINVQNEMLPVLSCGAEDVRLRDIVAQYAGVAPEAILGSDLFLYSRVPGTFFGAQNEFIAGARLDDLACAYTTLRGFADSAGRNNGIVPVYCVFDNEETGSLTRQGADSTFLYDVFSRMNGALGRSREAYHTAVAQSFLLSADNAHAAHPNYSALSDPVNRPHLNGGVVLKFSAAQKYTTDGVSAAMFRAVCERAGVPVQVFTNRSDMAGGSTLGNISNAHVSVRSADIGLAQWAMHSPCETAGALDADYMRRAAAAFYVLEG